MTRQSTKRTDASKVMPILSPVLGEELAAAVIEHRDDVIRIPLTETAARLQVLEYLKTGDPKAAAEMQILRGWRAIKNSWFQNELRKERGATTRQKPMTDFQRGQIDIKQQLESRIYGDRDEYAGATIDASARNFRAH